ncbi:hypothetical protein [Bacillus rubiinfantis]|uniref:hypothetical protein n=1 Tax=Bacillus rubiinfantis TaxID=1499680 RepID=UPI000AD1A919|nr:hypothetical protein [Bacillus rubiinfantis]
MEKRKSQKNNDPALAPGINDLEELQKSASEEEINNGEYTHVITLKLDDADPS